MDHLALREGGRQAKAIGGTSIRRAPRREPSGTSPAGFAAPLKPPPLDQRLPPTSAATAERTVPPSKRPWRYKKNRGLAGAHGFIYRLWNRNAAPDPTRPWWKNHDENDESVAQKSGSYKYTTRMQKICQETG